MVRAPAVAWKVGTLRWPWRLLACLTLGALLLWLAFSLQSQAPWASLLGMLLLLMCCAVAAQGLRSQPSGVLQWDGTHWHWSEWPQDALLDLRCVLDWQRLMLLQLHGPHGARRWLWLEAHGPSAQWLALRRAVVATPTQMDVANARQDP